MDPRAMVTPTNAHALALTATLDPEYPKSSPFNASRSTKLMLRMN
jgi:hypothetical protein